MAENHSIPAAQDESWLPVVGFEGRYEVSNLGRVKSLARKANTWFGVRSIPEKVMKTRVARNGYLNFTLRNNGVMQYTTVHSIVLRAFVGEPAAGQEARHINGNRDDCRLANLKWGTRMENMADQYLHGTRISGETHPFSKFSDEVVKMIRSSPKSGAQLAKELGANITTVCKARRGETYSTLLGQKPSA